MIGLTPDWDRTCVHTKDEAGRCYVCEGCASARIASLEIENAALRRQVDGFRMALAVAEKAGEAEIPGSDGDPVERICIHCCCEPHTPECPFGILRAALPGGDAAKGEAAEPWVIVAAHLSTDGVTYFWGPNSSGYTANLDKAGRYTEAEAKRKDIYSERMEVAVPLSKARAAAFPAVKDDDAHAWHRSRFPAGRPLNPTEPSK